VKLATLFFSMVLAGQAVSPQSNPRIHLDGVVLDSDTDRPLSGVSIQIAGLNVSSDAEGRFVFEKVPAGRQVLLADKAGYLRARPEGRKLGNGGINLTLSADQKTANITLRMFRAGSVTGRVFDALGAPIQNALIIPYRLTYDSNGDLALSRLTLNLKNSVVASREMYLSPVIRNALGLAPGSGNNLGYDNISNVIPGRSNDLGEFRIGDLEPGKYSFYILSSVSPVPFFYPGVFNAADAEIVEVVNGANLQLRMISLTDGGGTAKLSAQFIDQTGSSTPSAYLQIRKKGVTESVFQKLVCVRPDDIALALSLCSDPDPLPPGSYEVEEIVVKSGGYVASGRASVQMSGVDVHVDIPVSTGTKVYGHAVLQRAGAAATPATGLQLQFRSDETLPNVLFPMKSAADGTLQLASVPSGVFRIRNVSGVPNGMCLNEVRQGDRNVLRDGLDVSGGEVTFNAALGESQASVNGKVTDSNQRNVDGAVVVLVPDDPARVETYVVDTTDQNGNFELSCLQTGSYHLYAWLELDGAAYRNAEFMKTFQNRGTPIQIDIGGNASANLKLLEP